MNTPMKKRGNEDAHKLRRGDSGLADSPVRRSTGSQPSPWQTPGYSHYLILCLASLVLIVLLLTQFELNTLTWFVVLVGVAGVAWRWRLAPILMLVILTVGIKIQPAHPGGSMVPDLLLSVAVLGCVAGHYRLQSLANHIFPPDPRRREGKPRWRIGFFTLRHQAPVVYQRRSPQRVSSQEIGLLVLSLPLWGVLAQVAWKMLPLSWGNPGLPVPIWRAIWIAWIIGLAWYGISSVIDYRWRRQMRPEEAQLFLQDILWRETRREQARIVRWSAWCRLRKRRREEK